MKNLFVKAGAFVASSAVIFTVVPTAFAASTVTIQGNGSWSKNHVTVNNTTTNTVSQSSSVFVGTYQKSSASTGYSNASGNTGGSVTLTTGDATSKNKQKTVVLPNVNTQANTCGCEGSTTVTDKGNGSGSHNYVTVNNTTTQTTIQTQDVVVMTGQDSSAKTGGNTTNNNTNGNVQNGSGDSSSSNSNTVVVGGNVN